MKILYSLAHPADSLAGQRAGHVVRASAILNGLERLGHEVVRIEAAQEQGAQVAVSTYRRIFKRLLPRSIAMRMRDAGRIAHGRMYAAKLMDAIEQHQPDVILETNLSFTLAGKLASEATGVPLVLDDVAPAWEEEQQYGVGLKRAARRIFRKVTEQAGLLIAVNKTIRDYLIEEGLPESKVAVVENGIDGEVFHPGVDGTALRQQVGFAPQDVVIVFVGSFQPYHRVDLLLKAFAQLPEDTPGRLLLVGEGRETPEAKAIAEQLGLMPRVVFAGRVPYEQVPAYVAAGDIAIMPATNEYGNPMKVYEYMALGKAVVAPNQKTITEIVTHDQDVYLFAQEDILDMRDALQRLIEDPALRKRLGEQGGRASRAHTWLRRAETMQDAILAANLVQKR